MTQPQSYHLPADAVAALAKQPFGKLTPLLTLDEVAVPFTAFDDFDQSLRQSGRMLIEMGGGFELLTPDGRVLSQPSKRKGDFVADFPAGPVKAALADHSPLRSLLPIGSGQIRTGQLVLLDDEQKTHCRAHLRILSETGTAGVAVVTLQGLRGYATSLAALRRHVVECGGVIAGQDRLCAALFPAEAAYTAKPEIRIAPDDTAHKAATDIIASYIPVARANEAGIIADHDTEFLHDYRIALRKIRSVLSLFKGVYTQARTDELKTRFSQIMAPTGRLRDLDVYLLDRQHFHDLLPATLHGGLDRMFTLFAEERKAEKATLARYLQSKTYEKEIAGLAKLFQKRKKLHPGPMAELGAHDYACVLIWERYRKIRKIAARIGPDTEDAEVHRLRIHCKKLRYLMEFFGPLFPKPEFKSLLKPLKQLQDNLGLFNDYAVQQVSLQAFIDRRNGGPAGVSIDVAQSVGALTAVLHLRQLEERAKVVESFAQFNSPETVAIFRALFHAGEHKE
ncbi:MAG: CHAD domain-containing protein [Paracoccaceae bacterium]